MDAVDTSQRSAASAQGEGDAEVPLLSVVMPCLNESLTLAACIRKAQSSMRRLGIRGEIIVADNGSTDGSQRIAADLDARVIRVEQRGYGSALRGGLAAARGRFVIIGDADDTYDFSELEPFLDKLREGHDLVMGNRFLGGIRPGAMPPLHRYLGTPVLSWLGRVFFKCPARDFNCGLRGLRRESLERLRLRTTGMEFASEMLVKASLFGLRIAEVPTTLSPDIRDRAPHLRTWRDGWRHLRFLLLYSPRWLFLYPGVALFLLGIAVGGWLLPGPRSVGAVTFDTSTLVFATMAILLGFQAVVFAVFTKVFAINEGLMPEDPRLTHVFRYVTLEAGIAAGALLSLIGLAIWVAGMSYWGAHHFGPLNPDKVLRIVIPGLVALTLGVQTILSSFFLSVLSLPRG